MIRFVAVEKDIDVSSEHWPARSASEQAVATVTGVLPLDEDEECKWEHPDDNMPESPRDENVESNSSLHADRDL